jgi:phosphoglucan,water dikinase
MSITCGAPGLSRALGNPRRDSPVEGGMVFIGNQTSCWAPRPTEPFDYALSERFDAFEWFPDKKPEAGWDDADLDGAAREQIRQSAGVGGMRLSVHARWQANPLRADSQPLFDKDVRLASDLGARLLNIHLYEEQGLPRFVEAVTPWIKQTAQAGLQLSIENTPHHTPEQFNELFARLRELDSISTTHVGMCLDIGHANLAGATLNNYIGFCDRLEQGVPIIHVHLHENWGDADSHLPLFTGPAGRDDSGIRALIERLKQRHFSRSIILEQWPQPPSLLQNARDRLLKLWGPQEPKQPSKPASKEQTSKDQTEGHGRARHLPGRRPGAKMSSQLPAAKSAPALPVAHPGPGDKATPSAAPGAGAQAHVGPGLADKLVAADQRTRSWREKLEAVSQLMSNRSAILGSDELVDLAIYLQFLAAGQVGCTEDGRHFRPAHHSRMACGIYQALSRVQTNENTFILRKIYPSLPSFAAEFQRAEPLTRIRDIAHRNDIDSELKREIKTTLQNKLHRCAGPEDLATSNALLQRITARGASYPTDFVEQFRTFHEELSEFFSAHSLERRLASLEDLADQKQAELIDSFLQKKAGTSPADRLGTLATLTQLRQALAQERSADAGPNAQAFMLADIALENFAFVLVSQIINDRQQPAPAKEANSDLPLLALALENLALGGVAVEESRTVAAELHAWGQSASSGQRHELLRYRASLLRCRRLAEDFGAWIIRRFSTRVEKLGRALRVAESAIQVFCEATIRSHVVFQVSKLADLSLRRTRQQLRLPPWDVLVPGRAAGRAVALDTLSGAQFKAPAIACLEHATGDEEIPKGIVGIALAHEMPHLSHLGVRARQAGIVFVACEDPQEFSRLQRLAGQTVALEAAPERVQFEPAALVNTSGPIPDVPMLELPQVSPCCDRAWISLAEATLGNSGGKAHGARRLWELAHQAGAGFSAPAGLVIPFGVMESALEQAPGIAKEYRELAHKLDGMSPVEFAKGIERLGGLLLKLELPAAIANEVQRHFTGPLAVRSSADLEDLEQFAGAGLYDSMINVPPEGIVEAIRTIWSSLWTARAAESRRAARVAHVQAHMAILIQELIDPEYSFVLHTVDPVTQHPQELSAELVVGLGETLVSGANAGTPYRLRCAKKSSAVEIQAFANFSQAAHPARGQGTRRQILDYSKIDLSRDPSRLEQLGQRLCRVGVFIEHSLGAPQDIEGGVVKDRLWVVQSRAQQGLAPKG